MFGDAEGFHAWAEHESNAHTFLNESRALADLLTSHLYFCIPWHCSTSEASICVAKSLHSSILVGAICCSTQIGPQEELNSVDWCSAALKAQSIAFSISFACHWYFYSTWRFDTTNMSICIAQRFYNSTYVSAISCGTRNIHGKHSIRLTEAVRHSKLNL
jgi:hypothetical protein